MSDFMVDCFKSITDSGFITSPDPLNIANMLADPKGMVGSHMPDNRTYRKQIDYEKIGPKPKQIKKIDGVEYVEKKVLDKFFKEYKKERQENAQAFADRIGDVSKRMSEVIGKGMGIEKEFEKFKKFSSKEKEDLIVRYCNEINDLKNEINDQKKQLYLKNNPTDEINEGKININF